MSLKMRPPRAGRLATARLAPFVLAAIALLAAVWLGPAAAQNLQRIAAIVNDEVVSAQDLELKLDIAISSTGQQSNPELRRRLRDQVLRALIDERLQQQEAARLKVTAEAEEIDRGFRTLEEQNNIPAGKLEEALRAQGMSVNALTQQIRTEIVWGKVVRRRILPTVIVTEEEVNIAIEQLKREVGNAETLVAEILLLVDTPDQEEETRRNALRIVEQVKGGGAFSAMARQFSQGTSAAQGGDLGWVRAGTLAPEVERAIENLPPMQLTTEPVRSAAGYHIVLVRERRKVSLGNPEDTVVSMKQIAFPVPRDASKAEADSVISIARAVYDSVNGCADLDRAAKELDLKEPTDMGKGKVGAMPRPLRPIALGQPVGKLSTPVPYEGGIRLYMVCERQEPTGEPDREQVRNQLVTARIEQGARRLLRDLRRDAVVEYR